LNLLRLTILFVMQNSSEVSSIGEMFAFSASHTDYLHDIIIVEGLEGTSDVLDIVWGLSVVAMLTVQLQVAHMMLHICEGIKL
jgi:hypothetical protein